MSVFLWVCLHFLGFLFLISGWLIGTIVRQLDSQTTPSIGLWATFSWLAEHFRALINCKRLTLAHKSQKRKHFGEKGREREGEKSQSNWFSWRKENAIEKLIEKLLLRVEKVWFSFAPFPWPHISGIASRHGTKNLTASEAPICAASLLLIYSFLGQFYSSNLIY